MSGRRGRVPAPGGGAAAVAASRRDVHADAAESRIGGPGFELRAGPPESRSWHLAAAPAPTVTSLFRIASLLLSARSLAAGPTPSQNAFFFKLHVSAADSSHFHQSAKLPKRSGSAQLPFF